MSSKSSSPDVSSKPPTSSSFQTGTRHVGQRSLQGRWETKKVLESPATTKPENVALLIHVVFADSGKVNLDRERRKALNAMASFTSMLHYCASAINKVISVVYFRPRERSWTPSITNPVRAFLVNQHLSGKASFTSRYRGKSLVSTGQLDYILIFTCVGSCSIIQIMQHTTPYLSYGYPQVFRPPSRDPRHDLRQSCTKSPLCTCFYPAFSAITWHPSDISIRVDPKVASSQQAVQRRIL